MKNKNLLIKEVQPKNNYANSAFLAIDLAQLFSTAGPRIGANSASFFAGPQNIFFPHIIVMFFLIIKLILVNETGVDLRFLVTIRRR